MLVRRLFLLLAALGTLGGVGCLRCHHTAYGECLRPVEEVHVGAPARAKVYVFLMNGADLFDVGGLKELECKIVAAGFPKVYYAQRFDKAWYYKELHRLHREDPDNRFVLVGLGTAADQLRELACCVSRDQIPLDRVIFLDPVGVKGDLTADQPYPSLVIRSHHWVGSRRLIPTSEVMVQGVGHLNLPDHESAVAAVVDVLTESAHRVPILRPEFECIPILTDPKPDPRPSEPKQTPAIPPGWSFLCPDFGHR